MPRLGNPIVYDLLDVAFGLAETRGRPNLRKAAHRRAVSSAYYAVFHALCFVCASELLGWTQPNTLVEPVYRLLDHGAAKQRLKGRGALAIGPQIVDIGNNFIDLQEARNLADYSPPGLLVRHDETLRLIALAAQTVTLIEQLPTTDRKQLAVLLIAKPRLA
ncbi:hypothetical protein MKK64_09155 [Methylobacterium sp. E-025]|uniref:hypothetical protein n=1 Tax=Methylobacterium sp. E-025 TaxID=2836561 RepID=UPI001FBA5F45|nr:hypothetical protein [Methylobacterium sp. E-025]MCJ2111358.1 hypothetical protein [Methylobacterium sp. E-025]